MWLVQTLYKTLVQRSFGKEFALGLFLTFPAYRAAPNWPALDKVNPELRLSNTDSQHEALGKRCFGSGLAAQMIG